jgi:hypothetical protein
MTNVVYTIHDQVYLYIGKEDKDLPSSAMWVARFIRGKTTHIGVNVIPAWVPSIAVFAIGSGSTFEVAVPIAKLLWVVVLSWVLRVIITGTVPSVFAGVITTHGGIVGN